MTSTAKRFGKKIIGYPEDSAPIVSSSSWVKDHFKDPRHAITDYLSSLFPILSWITRYNVGWLTGDLIAGLTVGIVLVPQGMSYAQLATLPPQYGLYSSFVGTLMYCFFATSKDVSIGPVAVMSLTTAQIISSVDAKFPNRWSAPDIATAVAFICGFIVLAIGLFRIGWLVEFIPAPAVSGFMTGSAINIVVSQLPGLMGITGFSTRAPVYQVVINFLKGLPSTRLDAAWGLSGLVALYAIRMTTERLQRRYPRYGRFFFFLIVARNAFVILVLTIAAWLYCRDHKTKSGYPIKVLQTVPRGFQNVGPVSIDPNLVSALAPQLPVATIILLLEHIAIAKSFGRVNNYKINPNQELIAIGVTNTIGSVFHAYPATGSFSRSALQSKSGVRTPASGIAAAIVVIVALYGLTPAFYWIPTAGLCAVIIHAVADLVAPPAQVYTYWRVSPLEFFIWLAAVLVTVFSTIENGIYTSISASLALLLLRIAHPRGYFLGKVTLNNPQNEDESRDVFVPLRPDGVTHPGVKIEPPAPGIIIFRFEESYLYPNCAIVNSTIVDYVKEHMRRGVDVGAIKLQDRPWNDPGPANASAEAAREANNAKPQLRAVILDFSGVSQIDTTAVQALIDTRSEVERWAAAPVEFHFASILSPWIQRALIAGGFGSGSLPAELPREVAAVVTYGDAYKAEWDVPLGSTPIDLEAHETSQSSVPRWSKIKHRKGIEDAKKSKIYGKAAREITSAAKAGGSTNPEENGLLADAIRRARDAGVPKENIENTLARAERTKNHGQSMLFEALYNGSVGILVECRSDNVNRTVKQVKDLLSYRARSAPVKFMFQQRGYVKVRIGDDVETLLDRVMHVCSIDFAEWQEASESGTQCGVELVCPSAELSKVMKVIADVASTSPLCEVLVSEVNWAALESQEAEDTGEMDGLDALIEALEENDDVERVYTTLEPNHLIADVS
ncbi:sulfate transporter family-domain-containing protein [Chiua virens]|nr:sulfate transporter family-domain-containing protein [Chiua virens]